jgi:hypothetical protein
MITDGDEKELIKKEIKFSDPLTITMKPNGGFIIKTR